MTKTLPRILICEDHDLVRAGFIELLKDDVIIAGEAKDGYELIDKYFSLNPDVVLTDLEMQGLSGLQAAGKILERDPNAKILLLTMHYIEEYISVSYNLGLKGILSKEVSKDELLYAIKTAAEGKIYFGAAYPQSKILELTNKYRSSKDNLTKPTEVITEREDEVLKYMSQGLMSSEIAGQMNLSKKTIDAHRQKIMHKFNLKSSAALMKFALEYIRTKKLLFTLFFINIIRLVK